MQNQDFIFSMNFPKVRSHRQESLVKIIIKVMAHPALGVQNHRCGIISGARLPLGKIRCRRHTGCGKADECSRHICLQLIRNTRLVANRHFICVVERKWNIRAVPCRPAIVNGELIRKNIVVRRYLRLSRLHFYIVLGCHSGEGIRENQIRHRAVRIALSEQLS